MYATSGGNDGEHWVLNTLLAEYILVVQPLCQFVSLYQSWNKT